MTPAPTHLRAARAKKTLTANGFVARGGMNLAGGLAALLLCLLFLQTGPGKIWEKQTVDARFRFRGAQMPRAAAPPIVVIAVDDETVQKWTEPTLFWGGHYARVLRAAQKAGAQTVALDAIPAVDVDAYLETLNVPEETRPDTTLARALMDGQGKIVLASLLNANGTPILPIPRFALLPGVGENIGFIDLLPDDDGIVRDMPLFAADDADRRDGVVRPAFAALAAARFAHREFGDAKQAARLFPPTPLNEAGIWARFAVNYQGKPFPTVSAWPVEQNALSPADRARLGDALVFVGVTAAISNDLTRTPFPGPTPGVYLHAEAANTLLTGSGLRFPTPAQNAILCALLGLAILWAGRFLSARTGAEGFPSALLIAFLACVGLGLTAQWMFTRQNLVLPLGGMLLCLLIPCGIQQAALAVEERVRRQQLRGLLGRSVSPQVRDYLLQSPDRLELDGVERNAVILFFDIRGSLTFAESRTPTETLHELNDFFARLVPVLEQHHGLLYRYTGDGFLAVFGAPEPLPDASLCALRAAIGLVEAVASVNTARRLENKPPLPVGCGLHGGPVICGNLGIAERSDFTVIGDVVNRAARLEACNKTLHSEIVVSRTVWERLPDPKPVGFVGPEKVAIAGSSRGEEVYYRTAEKPTSANP